MKRIILAIASLVLAIPLLVSSPALASPTAYDVVYGCSASDEAGAVSFVYHGHITIEMQPWGAATVTKNFFYSDGQGGYKTDTWYAHNDVRSATIEFVGYWTGPSGDFLQPFDGFCRDL